MCACVRTCTCVYVCLVILQCLDHFPFTTSAAPSGTSQKLREASCNGCRQVLSEGFAAVVRQAPSATLVLLLLLVSWLRLTSDLLLARTSQDDSLALRRNGFFCLHRQLCHMCMVHGVHLAAFIPAVSVASACLTCSRVFFL